MKKVIMSVVVIMCLLFVVSLAGAGGMKKEMLMEGSEMMTKGEKIMMKGEAKRGQAPLKLGTFKETSPAFVCSERR